MEKITKKEKVKDIVEKDVTRYKTADGKEFKEEENAVQHEKLITEYPKLNDRAIGWVEDFRCNKWGEQEVDDLEEAFKSDQVILLLSYDGCNLEFDTVIPNIIAVTAVIKALHNKSVGMNCDRRVDGVIYKRESLSFNVGNNGQYVHGKGRNINEVLKIKEQ